MLISYLILFDFAVQSYEAHSSAINLVSSTEGNPYGTPYNFYRGGEFKNTQLSK
jgi:hypothetical protein